MRLHLGTKKIEFVYTDTGSGAVSTIDVMKEFVNRGGALSPNTEIEFSEYFPNLGYKKTALTNSMPVNYLCMGSMSLSVYEGSNYVGGIALSVYKDTTGHDPKFGDHKNLFLQYETSREKDHTEKIPNRHIKLTDRLSIEALLNGKQMKKITI